MVINFLSIGRKYYVPLSMLFTNWWGYNTTVAVEGRIRDYKDREGLLEVKSQPYYENNMTVLSGLCDPGYTQVGDLCLIYIGVPVNFSQAKEFCKVFSS